MDTIEQPKCQNEFNDSTKKLSWDEITGGKNPDEMTDAEHKEMLHKIQLSSIETIGRISQESGWTRDPPFGHFPDDLLSTLPVP